MNEYNPVTPEMRADLENSTFWWKLIVNDDLENVVGYRNPSHPLFRPLGRQLDPYVRLILKPLSDLLKGFKVNLPVGTEVQFNATERGSFLSIDPPDLIPVFEEIMPQIAIVQAALKQLFMDMVVPEVPNFDAPHHQPGTSLPKAIPTEVIPLSLLTNLDEV